MEQCEHCNMYFKLGINGSTNVMEDGKEFKLCNYCSEEFCKTYILTK